MSGRGRRAAVVLVALVALLGGLWVLSRRSVSPDQRVADAEPPPAAVVDLEVERRVLADTILVRGQVAIREELAVEAPGGAATEEAGPSVGVVGELPYGVGAEVPPGGVVAVVSDRPVIVVPMPLPMHRALAPGDEGPDVARLQGALASLGYEVEGDGRYGPGTQAAVEQLYADRGHRAARTGPELDDAIEMAEQARDEAESAVRTAQAAWDQAAAGTDQAAFDAADASLRAAREARESARSALADAQAAVGPVVPLGELVGIAAFPVVVSQLPIPVGASVEGPVVVLSPSDLVVRAPSDEMRATLLQPGLGGTATIEGDDTTEVPVIVVASSSASSAEEGGGSGSEAAGPTIDFAPTSPIPSELLGRPVTVEVVLAASDEAVLAVPTAAVRADGSGQYVQIVGDDGTTRRVGFTPGLAIGGWVEITEPEEPIDEGDVVRAA